MGGCENFTINKMQHCIMNGILYWYTILYSYISVYIFKTVVSDMLGWLNAVYITYVEVAMCYLSWTLVGIKTDFIFYTFLLQVDTLLQTLFVSYYFELLLFYFYYQSTLLFNHVAKMSCGYMFTWNILIKHVEYITTLNNISLRALI